jgi:hypothetical protein
MRGGLNQDAAAAAFRSITLAPNGGEAARKFLKFRGYAIPAASLHNSRIGVVAVRDPLDNPTGKLRIRAVARFELLDQERSRDLITEGAFQAGREVERTFERGARIGTGSAWRHGDWVDAAAATDLAIERGAEAAFRVNNYLAWLVHTSAGATHVSLEDPRGPPDVFASRDRRRQEGRPGNATSLCDFAMRSRH